MHGITMNKERITILSQKDLDISYFIGSGHGGQKKQKTSSGCQMIHKQSGAIGRASDNRSQLQNKKLAFERLIKHPKMKLWLSKKLFEIRENESMEEQIETELNNSDNMKFEVRVDGKWKQVNDDYFNTETAKQE
jgi:protein subunit release factor B